MKIIIFRSTRFPDVIARNARTGAVGIGLLLAALGNPPAHAATQWEVQPFLDIGALRDDNILLTTGPHDTTTGYVAAARAEGKATTETSKVNFNGAIAHTNYRGNNLEDTTDSGLLVNGETQMSERGKLGLDGEFRHDSITQTVIQQRGTGDVRDVDAGLATNQQVRRTYLAVAPWWNYLLTETSSIRIGYRGTDAKFSNAANTGLVDYREDLVSAAYSKQLNARDEASLTANIAHYRPETTGNDADTTQLLAGFARAFTERLRGTFSAGVSHSTVSGPGGGNENGLVASAGLRQTSEISTLEGVISHDVTPSGVGVAVQTDQFRIYWSRRLSAETEFILDGSLIRNRALSGSSSGIDRRYFDIGPQLRWQWLENVYIVATYRYRNQKFDALPDSAEGNAVFLGLSYRL